MIRARSLALASILLLAPTGNAQVCGPLNPQITPYGEGCGSSLFYSVPFPTGFACFINFYTSGLGGNAGRWLLIGVQPLAIPFPSGTCNNLTCTLLASPDFLLPVAPGQNTLVVTYPPDPSLIGASAYVQGIGAIAVAGPITCAGFTATPAFQFTFN